MTTEVAYEAVNGKRGVRIEADSWGSYRFVQLLSMRNGYQWSGMPVDRELLLMIQTAITKALEVIE